ncbi:MAG TPA: hypothetical protein VHU41_00395, partial [Thermoanaerobaculia bacterium]|nr:hypothetical protein [Thermoanaerobaculia bacterium]
ETKAFACSGASASRNKESASFFIGTSRLQISAKGEPFEPRAAWTVTGSRRVYVIKNKSLAVLE